MYTPPHFQEERIALMHALIRDHPFATLITLQGGQISISHLPMLLSAAEGQNGLLTGHLARANPQIAKATDGSSAIAIFQGPHGYVSPSWYPSKPDDGRVVPTWNYATVHAHGAIRTFDDPVRLRALVDRLTETHEARFAQPWSTADAPAAFIDRQLKGIVGLELPIGRLEGKWKLSQNRTQADREGVIAGLAESGNPGDAALAALMRQSYRE